MISKWSKNRDSTIWYPQDLSSMKLKLFGFIEFLGDLVVFKITETIVEFFGCLINLKLFDCLTVFLGSSLFLLDFFFLDSIFFEVEELKLIIDVVVDFIVVVDFLDVLVVDVVVVFLVVFGKLCDSFGLETLWILPERNIFKLTANLFSVKIVSFPIVSTNVVGNNKMVGSKIKINKSCIYNGQLLHIMKVEGKKSWPGS